LHTAILERSAVEKPQIGLLDQVFHGLQVPVFSPGAVAAYKDAVERSAAEQATWLARTFRHLPNRLLEASTVCAMVRILCSASSMGMMGAWCITVFQMMFTQNQTNLLGWLSIGIALSELGIVTFRRLEETFYAAWEESQELVWNVFDLSDTLNPDIPSIGIRLTGKIRQALKGHDVAFKIHRLGSDPFLEVVHYDGFGNRFSAIYYGFLDSHTELMEVEGKIVEAPWLRVR
jgi:hypothetical protein